MSFPHARGIAILLCAVSALSACRDESAQLSASTVDFPWPFTVDEGVIECRDGLEIVFVANGEAYPLNGAASSRAAERGYRPLEEIWRTNPNLPGSRVSISPMLQLGLDAC